MCAVAVAALLPACGVEQGCTAIGLAPSGVVVLLDGLGELTDRPYTGTLCVDLPATCATAVLPAPSGEGARQNLPAEIGEQPVTVHLAIQDASGSTVYSARRRGT